SSRRRHTRTKRDWSADVCSSDLCSSGGASSGSGSDDGGENSGGTLTIFTTGEEMSFDPAISQNLAITTLGLTARRLTAWKTSADAPTELIPDLATDVGTPTDDGATS